MFNIFDKKNDEPLQIQKEEIEQLIIKFKLSMRLKPGVDQIANAYGRFGFDITNPIPVNGGIGELKYLTKLYCSCDVAQLAHRLGSIWSQELHRPIDVYETVCLNANHWNLLYFDMFYDRRSSLLPEGYKSAHYSEPVIIGPIINAVNSYVYAFPLLLPNHARPDFESETILDPDRTYSDNIEIEHCQVATIVELRGSRDNEVVRKSLNGLGRILIEKQNLFVRPKHIELAIEYLMKQVSSQMKASKDENILRYYD